MAEAFCWLQETSCVIVRPRPSTRRNNLRNQIAPQQGLRDQSPNNFAASASTSAFHLQHTMANLQELTTPPSIADYTPLSEHQAATPSHFFGAKPVLHLYCPASRLLISQAELDSRPLFAALHQTPATNGSAGAANGTQEEQVSVENVDIWVTSEYVINTNAARVHPAFSNHKAY